MTSSSPPRKPRLRDLLAGVKDHLRTCAEDVDSAMRHDPAARSRTEVILTYPGLHAIWAHRLARGLWNRERKVSAKAVSLAARFFTGVEIHPAARLGRGVFIDHGMGVVIGETASVGDGCILYQGAVLGGTSMARKVRHPQLGSRVVVGAHACILGAIEVGDGARIGSGSVVIRAVPSGATVVGVPGRVVSNGGRRAKFEATLDHASLPDPVAEMLRSLRDENERLRVRLSRLEERLNLDTPPDEEDPHLVDGALATNDLPPQHGG